MPVLSEDSPDVISSLDVSSYLNQTFTPPAEFQDCENTSPTTNKSDNTITSEKIDLQTEDMDVTLTNNLNKNIERSPPQKLSNGSQELSSSFVISTMKRSNHNTNNYFNKVSEVEIAKKLKSDEPSTLNLSPITELNPIERALKSNFSPLEITVTPQPRKIPAACTSTPKQQSILNYMSNRTNNAEDTAASPQITPYQRTKPCISCTRLSKDQLVAIIALSKKKLASYSNGFNSSVTHMVVSVSEKHCIKDHTMKFVSAVAAGIWVVGFGWVKECLAKNAIVPEEPFEALDVSGIEGPRIARLRLSNPLLEGYRIHAAPPFMSVTKAEVENVIKMLGGEIAPSLESLREKRGIRLIITEAKATQDFDLYETWLEALQVVAVDIEWLSRSVGQYHLLSLKPFALCSDDTINNLGYPPELLVDSPFSFSQSVYTG